MRFEEKCYEPPKTAHCAGGHGVEGMALESWIEHAFHAWMRF